MHPALVFLICFLVVSIVCIIVCFCSWKHELSPALDAVLFKLFGITPHAHGIEQAAVLALQTASGAAVPVHFDVQPQPGIEMSQGGGQMGQSRGQIDQSGGQIGQPVGQMGQDVNLWPLVHVQEGQIPGQIIEEAQETT